MLKEFGKKFQIFQPFVYYLTLTYANLSLLKIKINQYKNIYNRVIIFDKSITSYLGVDIYLSKVFFHEKIEFRNECKENIFILYLRIIRNKLTYIFKNIKRKKIIKIKNNENFKIIYFEPEYDFISTRKNLSKVYKFINFENLNLPKNKIKISFRNIISLNHCSCKILQSLFFEFTVSS